LLPETIGTHTRDSSVDRFSARCADCLESVYAEFARNNGADHRAIYLSSVRYVLRMVAVLAAAERVPPGTRLGRALQMAADAVADAASGRARNLLHYESPVAEAYGLTGASILAYDCHYLEGSQAFEACAGRLLQPSPDAPLRRVFFETMPIAWLGCAYQSMLGLHPTEDVGVLTPTRTARKRRGVFFTPPSLVSYIIRTVLAEAMDSPDADVDVGKPADLISRLRILDPAMGGGDFLCGAVEFICSGCNGDPVTRSLAARNCCAGVELDPIAADIARFSVWAASGFEETASPDINRRLICADALADDAGIAWDAAFADVFARERPGFDAVVGNPPYIAARNGLANSTLGQSDSYILFLKMAMEQGLVREGGLLSMVLPDPMLVRENAAEVRKRLVKDWEIVSLLHISGAFRDASVANIVPVCRNCPSAGSDFVAARIDRVADRRAFDLGPVDTFRARARPVRREVVLSQKRFEMLYMIEEGAFGDIVRRIHGEDCALTDYRPPFVPLRRLNVRRVFRGEEIGKSAIAQQTGDCPILMGGQSIRPYEIVWEGYGINASGVRKPMERYHATKILIQKSSARLVAAIDEVTSGHIGYVFPQSVYGVELYRPGIHELYLLCLLNSSLLNEYIRRTATGYKFVQPQLEIEDIRALPIRNIEFSEARIDRAQWVASATSIFDAEVGRWVVGADFPGLIGCVRECLDGSNDRSDVAHDLLVYMGQFMVDLTRSNRGFPDSDTVRLMEATRLAIDSVVERLYSSAPLTT